MFWKVSGMTQWYLVICLKILNQNLLPLIDVPFFNKKKESI